MTAVLAGRPVDFFDHPLEPYMARKVSVAHVDTAIDEIAAAMDARRISGVPVIDTAGKVVGVVTRTDLVALGALQAGRRQQSAAMPLPRRLAGAIMTQHPQTISPRASIRDAARMMATHAIHRVFVVDSTGLVGVIGAVDIAAAVHDAHAEPELSTIMSSPIVSVTTAAPLGTVVDLLDRLRVAAVVVMADDKSIGVFSQTEALAARDLPRSTPIEALYDPALVCLPATTPLWRAAGQVSQLDVRRVIVCKDREAVGLVTALDFARFVAW